MGEEKKPGRTIEEGSEWEESIIVMYENSIT